MRSFTWCCFLCLYSSLQNCVSFNLFCTAYWSQTEGRFSLLGKNSLLLSCCFASQRLIHATWEALLAEGALRKLESLSCLVETLFITLHSRGPLLSDEVRISHFRKSIMVILIITKAVICQHCEELLTNVTWHKSEILQKQVFPQV